MNKKSTKYVLFGVLAIFVLLLNTSTALADVNGKVRIESGPVDGAAVYVLFGAHPGEYVGTTPFYLQQGIYASGTWFKMVRPGYKQANFPMYNYMYGGTYIRVKLNPIT